MPVAITVSMALHHRHGASFIAISLLSFYCVDVLLVGAPLQAGSATSTGDWGTILFT